LPPHAGVLAPMLDPVGTVDTTLTDPPTPHILATKALHAVAPSHLDRESWQKVESRKSWRQWLKVACCSVLDDLAGWCFNCFSTSHFAAQCQQWTRCFWCRALGHHSLVCLDLCGDDFLPDGEQGLSIVYQSSVHSKVWRPSAHGNPPPNPFHY
jgi:hypothetical protein